MNLSSRDLDCDQIAIIGFGPVGIATTLELLTSPNSIRCFDLAVSCFEQAERRLEVLDSTDLFRRFRNAQQDARVRIVHSTKEAVASAKFVFICVGTPQGPDGSPLLEDLLNAAAEVSVSLEAGQHSIIVIRSTVPPGTSEKVQRLISDAHRDVTVACNPAFFREWNLRSDLDTDIPVVVGCEDSNTAEDIIRLFGPRRTPIIVPLREAELLKYATNAFHALKIAFANEIGRLAGSFSVDANNLMTVLCRDKRLNISGAYLNPGPAFGGRCLPKDLCALLAMSDANGLRSPLLRAIWESNELQRTWFSERTLDRK